jgi:hypothetical protein
VSGEPGLQRHHSVGPLGLPPVGDGDEPGQQCTQLVHPRVQDRHPVEQFAVGELVRVQGGEVDRGELVEQGPQLGHRRPPLDHTIERMSEQ